MGGSKERKHQAPLGRILLDVQNFLVNSFVLLKKGHQDEMKRSFLLMNKNETQERTICFSGLSVFDQLDDSEGGYSEPSERNKLKS